VVAISAAAVFFAFRSSRGRLVVVAAAAGVAADDVLLLALARVRFRTGLSSEDIDAASDSSLLASISA
jgi:hypothetical protein